MAKPKRGEVWLVDMGYTAKVRPALVMSVPIENDERVITTVVPHTTSIRGTRFEATSGVRWLKSGVFDAQGIGTYPTVKLIKKLGDLPEYQFPIAEHCVRLLLELPPTNAVERCPRQKPHCCGLLSRHRACGPHPIRFALGKKVRFHEQPRRRA